MLYVNDLPDGLNYTVRLFADNALLYGIISNDTDGNKIQDDKLMYKLTHKLINIDTANHLQSHSEIRTRGSHSFKYRIPKFYNPRTIKDWNSLPDNLVNSDSFEVFKVKLDHFHIV